MAKKVIEKWKLKQMYEIRAPAPFGEKVIGETVATEASMLIGRVVEVGLDELTGDPSKAYCLLKFCIFDVKDKTALTKFSGHVLPMSYIKTLTRRRKTIVEDVLFVRTKDTTIRIKPIIFCDAKISRAAQTALRNALRTELTQRVAALTLEQFVEELFLKDFVEKLIPTLNKIAPVKRIEMRKTEIK